MHPINPKFIKQFTIRTNPETLFHWVDVFTQYGITSYKGYANGRTFYPADKVPDKFTISEDKKTLLRKPSLKIELIVGDKSTKYYNSIEELTEAVNGLLMQRK